MDIVTQCKGNTEEIASLDVAYDMEKWRGLIMAAIDFNRPTSLRRWIINNSYNITVQSQGLLVYYYYYMLGWNNE